MRDDLDAETIRCVMFEESLSLIRLEDDAFVLEDRYTLEPGAHVIDGTVRADRVFVVSRSSDSYREVFVLSGLASGRIEAELCVTGERGCAPNESGFVALGYAGVAASDL